MDNCFESESSDLNIRRDHDVTFTPCRNNLVLGRVLRVSSSNSIRIENAYVFDFLPPGPRVAKVYTRFNFLPLTSTSLVSAFRLFPAVTSLR